MLHSRRPTVKDRVANKPAADRITAGRRATIMADDARDRRRARLDAALDLLPGSRHSGTGDGADLLPHVAARGAHERARQGWRLQDCRHPRRADSADPCPGWKGPWLLQRVPAPRRPGRDDTRQPQVASVRIPWVGLRS